MKYIGKLSVILLLASCTNEAMQDAPAEQGILGDDEIVCSIAQDEETRTSLSGNNLPVSNSGDEISVLDAGGKHKVFELVVSGEGTATGTFRGVLPAGNSIYAFTSVQRKIV